MCHDIGNETALHWATINGKRDIVKLLLIKGADISAKAKNGDTALKLAQQNRKTDIVELLKRAGAKD